MSEWRYTPRGVVAHALAWTLDAAAACGVTVLPSSDWRGTGSQREYERAAQLPRCRKCAAKVGPR